MAYATRARSLSGPSIRQPPPERHQGHLVSIAPPAIDLPRQRHPDSVPIAELGQVAQQLVIHGALALADQVVGMGDDADQTMVLG